MILAQPRWWFRWPSTNLGIRARFPNLTGVCFLTSLLLHFPKIFQPPTSCTYSSIYNLLLVGLSWWGGFFPHYWVPLPYILTRWDLLPTVDMTFLKLVSDVDYWSAGKFLQGIIPCLQHIRGICDLSVRLGLIRLSLVLRQTEALRGTGCQLRNGPVFSVRTALLPQSPELPQEVLAWDSFKILYNLPCMMFSELCASGFYPPMKRYTKITEHLEHNNPKHRKY